MTQRDPLKEIIESPIEPIPYSSHPSDAILRDYIRERLGHRSSFDVAGLRAGSMARWHRAEVTAHLLTCRRCAQLVAELRKEPAPNQLKIFLQRLVPEREPVPTFARIVMIAQLVIIVGLVGVIYFKPALLFSSFNPTASVIPSSEITKPHQQAQQTLHSPGQPSDALSQLMQSYPHTIQVVFREDTPMREVTRLIQSVNGVLIFIRQSGFVVRLPSDDQLDSVMEKLLQSPYILEARKD